MIEFTVNGCRYRVKPEHAPSIAHAAMNIRRPVKRRFSAPKRVFPRCWPGRNVAEYVNDYLRTNALGRNPWDCPGVAVYPGPEGL